MKRIHSAQIKIAVLSLSLALLNAACNGGPGSPSATPPNEEPGQTPTGVNLRVDSQALADSVQIDSQNFSATDCAVVEGCVNGSGTRRLLRFEADIINMGPQDFVLGDPIKNPNYKFSSCHGHYHLQNMMEYALIDPSTNAIVSETHGFVSVRKQGFCLEDSQPYVDPTFTGNVAVREAGMSNPNGKYNCESQGISAGWEDVYDNTLDCQWLDITNVPPGNYLLRLTVNPDRYYPETSYTDNVATTPVTIF